MPRCRPSGMEIVSAYMTQQAQDKYQSYVEQILQKAEQCFGIEPHVGELLSDTKSSQGIYCICRIPSQDTLNLSCNGHYLALENLQDPANLGAILRTGEALGIRGVILGGSCCDVYSPKVLRASMGAVFRLPVIFVKLWRTSFRIGRSEAFLLWRQCLPRMPWISPKWIFPSRLFWP